MPRRQRYSKKQRRSQKQKQKQEHQTQQSALPKRQNNKTRTKLRYRSVEVQEVAIEIFGGQYITVRDINNGQGSIHST